MTNVVRVSPLTTAVTPVFINPSSLGQSQVVAAGGRIRVLALAVMATSANVVKFQSASNDISASFPLGTNGGIVLPFNEHGWFQTNLGEALNVNLGTATATAVHVIYQVMAS